MPFGSPHNIKFKKTDSLKQILGAGGSQTINDLDDHDLLLCLSFLKFYVIGTAERHLFGIVHVKVDFFGVQKMWVRGSHVPMLGRFV